MGPQDMQPKSASSTNKILINILTTHSPEQIINKYSNSLQNVDVEIKIQLGDDSSLRHLKFDNSLARMIYGRPLRKGEMNCSLGHRSMWCYAREVGSRWSVFLEDDAIITDALLNLLNSINSWGENLPFAIIIGHSKTVRKNLWFENIKIPLYSKKKIKNIVVGKKNQNLFGTVGYLLNQSAVELLSKLPVTCWKADDWKMFENAGLQIYHLQTPCIWEEFETRKSATGNICVAQHEIFSRKILIEVGSAIKSQIFKKRKC